MLADVFFQFFLVTFACYLFASGFLVTKTSVDTVNGCGFFGDNCTETGWRHGFPTPKFNRVLIVIVDAMRYDFIDSKVRKTSETLHFAGQLSTASEMSARFSDRSLTFVFRADPPTTTLQRLKALMSGTLPAFIEAGANFGSSHVAEDNLIDTLVGRFGRTAVCIGDDVWSGVFPTQFGKHAHWFPGLNVWDLHSVDDGVTPLLWDYLRDPDWTLLIAHFVGLDHAGHRFGPHHPALGAKLRQMSVVLDNITRQMTDDTLLVVFGDHGMDSTGNHGGDTGLEVNAGLWLYSKSKPLTDEKSSLMQSMQFHSTDYEDWQGNVENAFPYLETPRRLRAVNQIDLVPTIALLLGYPIPFENLGSAIIEPLFAGSANATDWALALAGNANQLAAYVTVYYEKQTFGSLSKRLRDALLEKHAAAIAALEECILHMNDELKCLTAYKLYLDFARSTLSACRSFWTQFKLPRMYAGVALVGLALVSSLTLVEKVSRVGKSFQPVTITLVAAALLAAVLSTLKVNLLLDNFSWWEAVAMAGFLGALVWAKQILISPQLARVPWYRYFTVLLALVQPLAMLSDSFTIHEETLVHVLLQTLLLVALLAQQGRRGVLLLLMLVNRLQHAITLCRNEQRPFCTPSVFESPNSSITWYPIIPIQTACVLVALYVLYARLKLPKSTITVTACCCAVASVYWILDTLEAHQVVGSEATKLGVALKDYKQLFARVAYPACLSLYLFNWFRCRNSSSARTQSLLCVLFSFVVINLLLKPMSGYSLALGLLQVALIVDMNARRLAFDPSYWSLYIYLLGYHLFFTTGREATLQSIDWSLAFIGLDGVNYAVSPILLIVSHFGVFTFSSLANLTLGLTTLPKGGKHTINGTGRSLSLLHLFFCSIATLHLRQHHSILNVFLPRWLLAIFGSFSMEVLASTIVYSKLFSS